MQRLQSTHLLLTEAPFLRKGNEEKCLRWFEVKLHKNWAKNQWQLVFWCSGFWFKSPSDITDCLQLSASSAKKQRWNLRPPKWRLSTTWHRYSTNKNYEQNRDKLHTWGKPTLTGNKHPLTYCRRQKPYMLFCLCLHVLINPCTYSPFLQWNIKKLEVVWDFWSVFYHRTLSLGINCTQGKTASLTSQKQVTEKHTANIFLTHDSQKFHNLTRLCSQL